MIILNLENFCNALKAASTFAAKNHTRKYFNGVNLSYDRADKALLLQATDGSRAIRIVLSAEGGTDDDGHISVTVPSGDVSHVLKVFSAPRSLRTTQNVIIKPNPLYGVELTSPMAHVTTGATIAGFPLQGIETVLLHQPTQKERVSLQTRFLKDTGTALGMLTNGLRRYAGLTMFFGDDNSLHAHVNKTDLPPGVVSAEVKVMGLRD